MPSLAFRLQQLADCVDDSFQAIWDCCCDHGYLGMTLAQQFPASSVHFVDINAALIADVQQRCQQYLPTQSHCQFHCGDVRHLPLIAPEHRQLYIIAGVGGDLLLDMVEQLVQRWCQHAPEHLANLEFLLCPVQHLFKVRQGLQHLQLRLVAEQLVLDNRRYYEILQVNFTANRAVSATGDTLWQHPQAHGYYQQLLKHYQAKVQGGDDHAQAALAAYQTLAMHR